MRHLLASLLIVSTPVMADAPVVLSPGPDSVAVTLYRDPARGEGAIDKANPTSFALIAETRTVSLPAGVVTVRFEGVAGGIVPQSAILFGTNPRERNRDAALLSQKGLVDAYTGQQVILRRTDRATGKVVEERATIRSAADRMVIQTPRGAEAVYCTGLAQTLLYPQAPATLSAKPVLTMSTREQPGGKATITLAYIATGFDWDATYVGTLATDGKSMALFAWLTMASGDETSFVDATTSAVAGRVNRSAETRDDTGRVALREARWLNRSSQCWPAGTTSDIASKQPPASAPMMLRMMEDNIVVSAPAPAMARAMAPATVTAKAENLGDLKLYRIPVPVTVAAHSQKQVAFLNRQRVNGTLVYRSQVQGDGPGDPKLLFRFRNSKKEGLGDPLPAGKALIYQDGSLGRQLLGESVAADTTTDEDVEWVFGEPHNVTLETDDTPAGKATRYAVTVRNANPFPVRFELEFLQQPDRTFSHLPGPLLAKPGKRVWATTLPANGERRIAYDVRDIANTP